MRSSFSNSLKAGTPSLGFPGTAVTPRPFRTSLPMESLISLFLVNIPGYHTSHLLCPMKTLLPAILNSPIPKTGELFPLQEQWDPLAQFSTFTGSIRQEFDIILVWKLKLFLLCFPGPPRLCSHHSSSATLSLFPQK